MWRVEAQVCGAGERSVQCIDEKYAQSAERTSALCGTWAARGAEAKGLGG